MTSGSDDREKFLASATRQLARVYRNGDPDDAETAAAAKEGVTRVRRLWDRFVAGPPPFPNVPRQAPLSDEEVDTLTARILERLSDPR